ncbi:hypothetical protein K501DRAFT_227394 [Backusella circina FSU 941]|nr:hypothetical protein K501DRAFT_227394 [Backusella circina FSU 941]
MATATEVYEKSNQALETLSNLWQSMLDIIQAVSASSAASLTAEPDLAGLQNARKEYEQLVSTLKTLTTWLDENKLDVNREQEETNSELLQEQDQLKQEAAHVSDKLKRMISQSYALQFQIELYLSSSQQITPC